MTGLLDRALDLAVIPGYSRIGYALRGLDWEDAVGRTLSGRAALVTGASSGVGEAVCGGVRGRRRPSSHAGQEPRAAARPRSRESNRACRVRARPS